MRNVFLLLAYTGLAGAQTAQEVVAQSEMESMANQLVLVESDTLWLTTLENLDDISSPLINRPFDFINDMGGALVIDPYAGEFFSPPRLDLLNRPPGLNWQGPYMTYQESRTDGLDSDYDVGTPLDPWGSPYYLYTPMGLVDPQTIGVTLDGYGDTFNSYTIVSLGPDGIVSSDDLLRTVGSFFIQGPALSSVRVQANAGRRAAWEFRFKGYNFGSSQGMGDVLVDGTPIDGTITLWSSTLIIVEGDALPAQASTFTVQTNGGATPSIEGFIVEGSVGVEDWDRY